MAPDNYYASVFGRTYSAYMERPWLSRAIGRFVWGGDSRPYYESMAAIAEASRVLEPGGSLVGATFLKREDSRRQKALIAPTPATSAASRPKGKSSPG
ncbi:MAG TPA: hypothetical protein VF125_10200 [Solirubrobacterales bacterium]